MSQYSISMWDTTGYSHHFSSNVVKKVSERKIGYSGYVGAYLEFFFICVR